VLLTSGTRGHRPAVLIGQLAGRIVDVKATEARQIWAEHAFFDGRHPERVDRRMIVHVARYVDRHQPVVRHIQQLSCANLRHPAALVLRPTERRQSYPVQINIWQYLHVHDLKTFI